VCSFPAKQALHNAHEPQDKNMSLIASTNSEYSAGTLSRILKTSEAA
jgi:hypothetical protein